MKIAASSLTEGELFVRVAAAIRQISGQKPEKITPDARLLEDLGIYGDDGHELFEMLHEQFEMDWTGLDLRVHFGSEGLGAPLPWQVRESPGYFEPQPVTVAELVGALRDGRWPESVAIPASAGQRRNLHLASWVQFGIFAAGALVIVSGILISALAS